jgi:hypothetical protein
VRGRVPASWLARSETELAWDSLMMGEVLGREWRAAVLVHSSFREVVVEEEREREMEMEREWERGEDLGQEWVQANFPSQTHPHP